ncbi:MAG TPA: hypothetical protein VMF30_03410, partial [Pirellulales bacterium]|nr:hypothetical protein [Pirellulales bacterium]
PQPVEVKVGFVELPGGSKMFNYALNRWDDRTADESIHVPIVPLEGRLGVVMKSSPHTSVAFELLAWLAGDNWGTRVASASTATTLYRRSQQRDAAQWVEMGIDRSTAHDYGQLAGHAASHSVWVDGLRIPGWPEYYAALDDAVAKALRGEASATDALKTAAETFATISDRLGVETQRAAYRRNLGLEP